MSEKDKQTAAALAEAVKLLPDEKKEYLLGYAMGVADSVKPPPIIRDRPA